MIDIRKHRNNSKWLLIITKSLMLICLVQVAMQLYFMLYI